MRPIFVPDGINSVGDYNSPRVGVVVVVVVIVVVVIVLVIIIIIIIIAILPVRLCVISAFLVLALPYQCPQKEKNCCLYLVYLRYLGITPRRNAQVDYHYVPVYFHDHLAYRPLGCI